MGKSKVTAATQDQGQSPSLGDYAHQVIGDQYRHILKQERKVIADKDPEYLHQMRVGTRRLRTALQVFEMAVDLPKEASVKQLASLAKVLGNLRDLDVQIATLQGTYYEQVSSKEQKALNRVLDSLHQQRRKALAKTQELLTRPRYQKIKAAFQTWLDHPHYTPLAQLPLVSLLPDLLSPLLSELLLHSGWMIPADDASEASGVLLHELRKSCKHARYQAEFFSEFYDQAFQTWIKEIRGLQENLGTVQDGHVLLHLIQNELSRSAQWPELQTILDQERENALRQWDAVRQKYLDPDFRQQLHQMILQPGDSASDSASHTAAASIAGNKKQLSLKSS